MIKDPTSWLLENYGQEEIKPGLSRMAEALSPIIEKLKKIKTITVAGTNGKGETILRLSDELKAYPHVVWTSPHIERLTERFRTETGEVDEKTLLGFIEKCHEDVKTRNLKLSYYEFLFLVFCTWALEHGPRFLLLEVGLGGRLDAVNVLDADIVLIPSISRDHQEFLGKRYDLILNEKLGVLRPKSKLLSTLSLNYLRERADAFVLKLGAEVLHVDQIRSLSVSDFSGRNELLAHAAYLTLMGEELKSLSSWTPKRRSLENRGELLRIKNNFIFFGSHNTDGVRKLIQFLHSENYNFPRPPYDLIVLGFSKRDSRDLVSMFRMLKQANLGKIVVTAFTHPKALPLEAAREISRQEGLDFAVDVGPLVHGASNQNILVTGSYYFLGSFKGDLRRLT